MKLVELTKALLENEKEQKDNLSNYTKTKSHLEKIHGELSQKLNLVNGGINLEIFDLSPLLILGKVDSPQRKKQVETAIADISNDCAHLFTKYFGVKNYAGFGDQCTDCDYGYGPKHGTIVFKISLKSQVRREGSITEAQKEAALYHLYNIEKIQIGFNWKIELKILVRGSSKLCGT